MKKILSPNWKTSNNEKTTKEPNRTRNIILGKINFQSNDSSNGIGN